MWVFFHRWQHVRSWDVKKLVEFMECYRIKTITAKPTLFLPSHHALKEIIIKIYNFLTKHSFSPHLFYIGIKQ